MSLVTDESVFNPMYWASQPPELQRVPGGMGTEAAEKAAADGFKVDEEIMMKDQSPYKEMKLRGDYGYTWTPTAFQEPIAVAPGLWDGAMKPYDANHPAPGSIKVSLDSDDYPPYNPPVPIPTPTGDPSYVGIDEGDGITFAVSPAGQAAFKNGLLVDGQDYPDDPRGPFVFHAKPRLIETVFTLWFNPKGVTES